MTLSWTIPYATRRWLARPYEVWLEVTAPLQVLPGRRKLDEAARTIWPLNYTIGALITATVLRCWKEVGDFLRVLTHWLLIITASRAATSGSQNSTSTITSTSNTYSCSAPLPGPIHRFKVRFLFDKPC